jgi:hypothetical protein
MGEQKMPNPNPNQAGQNQPGKQNPQQDRESASRPGQQKPQQDRESASRQPGKQAPGQEPRERASNPIDDDAARRQSKQDPLQNRDR